MTLVLCYLRYLFSVNMCLQRVNERINQSLKELLLFASHLFFTQLKERGNSKFTIVLELINFKLSIELKK